MANTQDRVILPQHSHPLKYEITLAPDLESFTFAGNETIDVEITEPTTTLSLNAADLEVHSASVTPIGGGMKQASGISYNEEAQTVTFDFGEELPTSRAKLELSFSGELNDRLHGFYRSTYQSASGETRVLAATQFEPTDARRAFPCWDEPNKKATFNVTLVISSHLTAVCNTSIVGEWAEGNDKKRVQFAETPPMSTYLLAFVVGELESIEDTADSGTLLRIWTTPGKSEQGRFALEAAKQLLAYYNDYFGIPYPLEKLDQLAIPDFAAGAMENWGAITYREVALLFDAENSSPRARQPHCGGGCPRDGAHVVRRPCDHGLVERSMAQRKLCFMDGNQGGRPSLPGMVPVDAICIVRCECGVGAGRPGELAPYRARGEGPHRNQPTL